MNPYKVLDIPEDSIEVSGLYYLFTKSLAWENISIVDVISTYTEMTFIVKEKNKTVIIKMCPKLSFLFRI